MIDGKFDRAAGEAGLEALFADILPEMLDGLPPGRAPAKP
jgi:hypothetical protein